MVRGRRPRTAPLAKVKRGISRRCLPTRAKRKQRLFVVSLKCIRLVGLEVDGAGLNALLKALAHLPRVTHKDHDVRLGLELHRCQCIISPMLLERLRRSIPPCPITYDEYEATLPAELDVRPDL